MHAYILTCMHTKTYCAAGGAIYATGDSQVVFDTIVRLSNNTADESGGAIYLKEGALLSSKNDLLFEANKAGAYGGVCGIMCTYMPLCAYVYFSVYIHIHA
jgi:predicted outer membrane repeat protein